jgi:hypothetical protein
MDKRTIFWVIVGAVVLMAAGFYLSSVLNLSQQVSMGARAGINLVRIPV